jgi:hypothetical protein
MRALLIIGAVATIGLALAGPASASDSLPITVHATVALQSPTANCPAGKAAIPMQVVTSGEMATVNACITAVSPCGDSCLQANIRYTFPLASGKVVVQVVQQQTVDAFGSVAGVTMTGTVTKGTKAYGDLVGSRLVGGGAAILNPDGTAALHLAFAILAGDTGAPAVTPPAAGTTQAAPAAASQVLLLDAPLVFHDTTRRCAVANASTTMTLLPSGESGSLVVCVMSADACGANCSILHIRLDGDFPSGSFRVMETNHYENDAAQVVSGEIHIGTVTRGSGVFRRLVGHPYTAGGTVVGVDARFVAAALA